MIRSDVAETLACRWDDGQFVVDPQRTMRTSDRRRSEPISGDAPAGKTIPAVLAVTQTLEEWQLANGYDPITRTYS